MSEYEGEEKEDDKKLTLVSERKSWVRTTSEDLDFDIAAAMREQIQPINTREQLDERIKLLAVHILKYSDLTKIYRKTAANYFIEIQEAAKKLGYTQREVKQIAEEIFRQYQISESHIRRIIPHELKDQSKTNIRYRPGAEVTEEYEESTSTTTDLASGEDLPNDSQIQLKNAIERIKDLEILVKDLKEKLKNSIMIGQETEIYKKHVALGNEQELPLIIAVNFKEHRCEYVEIDTEAIRQAHEENIQI